MDVAQSFDFEILAGTISNVNGALGL